MKNILWIILCLFINIAHAADIKYPVSDIPEELKKNVNAVVREDKKIYKIISQNKATVYAYMAVTIFNENAKDYASLVEDYDNLTKITIFNGSVYDASGKLIKKLKGGDIYDQTAYDGSLYSDNRLKSAGLAQSTYPYTVVFEYEKEYKFLYFIDGSVIIPDEKIAVQKASYQLIYPPALTPRYKAVNITSTPKKEIIENGYESLTWTFENLSAIKFEPYGRPGDVIPVIKVAPSQFEYDGYVGNMSTWKQYGLWQSSLNKGRDVLPEITIQKIKDLTKDKITREQKVKVLYEYLQQRTRYVNIALGIGGLQPFDANVVDKVGYGDCKALSNYMVAILKEAGIKAYYTKIMAGPDAPDIKIDFPSHQTNHIIVGVPNERDTLWLECTNQTNPFGYLGTFTGDRKAIMVTEDGGVIVKTTHYTAEQNTQSRTANVFIEATGNAKGKVVTHYGGLQYENSGLEFILDNQYDDQKKWLQKNMGIPSFDLTAFSMVNKKEKIPMAIVTVDLTLNRLATVSGKRMFLTPNLMNRSAFIPEKIESRKTAIFRRMAYIDLDTIRYHLPEELYPEFLPTPVKITSRFGEYEATYSIDAGNLIYIRRVKINKGEFPAESYQEFTDFHKNINKADNAKIVFLNKT